MTTLNQLTLELQKAKDIKIYSYNEFRKVAKKIDSLNKQINDLLE